MRIQSFTIHGRLHGMNEIIEACRKNRYAGAEEKREQQATCFYAIREHRVQPVQSYPVTVSIEWVEPNTKRDPDNISAAKKFIFDALQEAGVLRNDSMKELGEIRESFTVDAASPRVRVTLQEE